MKAEDRFWSYVKKSKDCWEWQGGLQSTGRGGFWYEGKTIKAHRASWILNKGEIPKGLLVCHHCDNPKCVKPEHLFLGTYKDNSQDMYRKGRNKGNTKIDNSTREKIRSEWNFRKTTHTQLGKKYKVHHSTIQRICASL